MSAKVEKEDYVNLIVIINLISFSHLINLTLKWPFKFQNTCHLWKRNAVFFVNKNDVVSYKCVISWCLNDYRTFRLILNSNVPFFRSTKATSTWRSDLVLQTKKSNSQYQRHGRGLRKNLRSVHRFKAHGYHCRSGDVKR